MVSLDTLKTLKSYGLEITPLSFVVSVHNNNQHYPLVQQFMQRAQKKPVITIDNQRVTEEVDLNFLELEQLVKELTGAKSLAP